MVRRDRRPTGPAYDRYGKERRLNRDGRDAFPLSALARIRFRGACGAAGRYWISRIDRAAHLRMGDRALFVLALGLEMSFATVR